MGRSEDSAAGNMVMPPGRGRPYALVEPPARPSLDSLDFGLIDVLFRTHGAVLIRGCPPDVAAFRRFSDPFCGEWVVNDSSNRSMIDPAHIIQSVNKGTAPFSLHSEISRAPWRPDICFFYCLEPPVSDGETLVCDGAEVAQALPERVRAALAGRQLVYCQRASTAELAYWLGSAEPDDSALASPPPGCPFQFLRQGDTVIRIFSRPALQATRFGRAPAFANFLLFARDMHENRAYPLLSGWGVVPDDWVDAIRETCAQHTAAIAWQAGDLLILDNSRFMHGRNAVTDPFARVIASRFGYLRNAAADPEEPADPVWRRERFVPPQPFVPADRD